MEFIKAHPSLSSGTSLQASISVPYVDLLAAFGEPHGDGDGHKVDAQWALVFADGTVATIYNYKNGKNYNGDKGLELFEITDWHVGGNDWKAGQRVMAALGIV